MLRWIALGVLLAGCAGASVGPVEPQAGEGGAIEGVVVTPAIVPVAGAVVVAQPAGATGVTDAEGRFRLDGVPPGLQVLTASHAGFLDAQATARVAAEGTEPALVRLVLETDPQHGSFVEAYRNDGFLDLSATLLVASVSGGGLLGEAALGAGYPLGTRLPDLVQVEMVWQATQDLARDMLLAATPQNGSAVETVALTAEGPSPLLLTVDQAVLVEWGLGRDAPLGVTAFVGSAVDTPAGGVGLAAQQGFAIFTHLFYGALPPDGWRFTSDGAPAPRHYA